MRLSVIAVDYDGTIARGDVLDPTVRTAIAAARTNGITVLLVTGRIRDDLRRVAGDLHLVDGVIAENGAIVHFPDSGHTSTLAPLMPEVFATEVRRRGIPVGVASPAIRYARYPIRPAHRSRAAWWSSYLPGSGKQNLASATVYSAYPPSIW